jgi:Ca2+-transporting ATPase
MTVTNIYAGLKDISWSVDETGPVKWENCFASEFHRDLMYQSMACNVEGGATDEAMIKFIKRFEGGDIEALKKKHGKGDFKNNVKKVPFTSKRKRMSTIISEIGDSEHGHDRRILSKGASEAVFKECTHFLNEKGEKQELGDTEKTKIEAQITTYAKQSMRTICLCYKDLKVNEFGADHDDKSETPEGKSKNLIAAEEGNMTMILITGIKDPLRPGVAESIEKCTKSAGIKVRMVTGDNLITAIAISKDAGILTEA